MLPAISVIIRTYNSERYVRDALESVLAQDYYGKIELVICYDESSKDDTLKILQKYVLRMTPNRSIKLIRYRHVSPFRAFLHSGP
ncbi:glycosyltransferase [Candidatus Bathyarchaeota archaeon]|nr:glycosyltransferase [Candidatus Bathyarchaeota archaeon]